MFSLLTLSGLALSAPALADEDLHTTELRPTVILAEASLGGPAGIMGGRVGYKQWELGGGIGATGYKVSGQWKHYWRPFDSEIFSFPVGVGPSVGLSGAAMGVERSWGDKEPPNLLFASWINAEISAEWRARWGGVWRWTAGAALSVYENQSWLCEGEDSATDTSAPSACNNQGHVPIGPEVASVPAFPYLGFSYGYAF